MIKTEMRNSDGNKDDSFRDIEMDVYHPSLELLSISLSIRLLSVLEYLLNRNGNDS